MGGGLKGGMSGQISGGSEGAWERTMFGGLLDEG